MAKRRSPRPVVTRTKWLSGASNAELMQAVADGLDVGLLIQPKNYDSYLNYVDSYGDWAVDNGKFTQSDEPWDPDVFRAMLWDPRMRARRDELLFVTVPDDLEVLGTDLRGRAIVVGDAAGTLREYAVWAPEIRAMGYRTALVAQDGLETMLDEVPWDTVDVIFIGGSDDWKVGDGALAVCREAKRRGKGVHFGRCNSSLRLRTASGMLADTADGNFLRFGPSKNLPRVRQWLVDLDDELAAAAIAVAA